MELETIMETCGQCVAWTQEHIAPDQRLSGFGNCIMGPPQVYAMPVQDPAGRLGMQITSAYPAIPAKFPACLQGQPAALPGNDDVYGGEPAEGD